LSAFAGTALLAKAAPRRETTFFRAHGLNIGLQIYTLGDIATKDPDAAFALVAQIGYREIELPNLLGRSPQEIRAAADRAGLSIVSLHVPLLRGGAGAMQQANSPAKIADQLGTLGAKWAVAPLLVLPEGFRMQPGETMPVAISRNVKAAGKDIWKATAGLLNERAAALKPSGIGVAYHNHNLEFAPVETTTGWEILTQETDKALVFFEVDIGWVAAGGRDPVALLDGIRGRAALFHVKDIGQGNTVNYDIAMPCVDMGAGVMPLDRILPAAYRAGVRHFFVEQEPPFAVSREASTKRAFEVLSQIKASR
jgi:sugar phosphate isomerase/epimerase